MQKAWKQSLMRIFYIMESSHLLSIVRRALTMLVPVVVVGAGAYAILWFPNEAFRHLITERYEIVSVFLETIYDGVFGLFSMELLISLSISYVIEKHKEIDTIFFYITTTIACYGTQIVMTDEQNRKEILGHTGCFMALLVGLLSCFIFDKLRKIESISLRKYTIGMETIPANAIQSIIPATLTIGIFALLQYVIAEYSGEAGAYALIKRGMYEAFEGTGNNFISALLYTVIVHVLWVFGFHGSHMMENVAVDNFSAIGENIVFSKSFYDTFVIMGGSGTTICVLIGIFFYVKKKRTRNIAKIALPTAIFNVNEILNFGIPIVLNPVLAIPFVCVPVMALIVSYGATALGIVPCVTGEVVWTMPIFLNGYMATGSIAGSILQLVIVVLGVWIYVPFLKMNEEVYGLRMQEKVKKLIAELQECEKRGGNLDFLHRVDDSGMVARMLLQDLKNDLQRKKLYLVYQPQVDGEENYIGGEALLRWQHSEYGFIYPPLIVYLATEGEILPQLEQEVVEMAVKAIERISRSSREDFKISINLTAHSLNWEIEKYIEEKLSEYEVPAEKLWIEITEQDVLTSSETVTKKIQQLKEAGHKLLIDDFGMGHTSLIYLQSNNFEVVKLDGSLVRSIVEKETDQKIVASIVELGRNLGIKVIAEYVETEEQRKKLEELGCYYYQGYLYGKPMLLEEFIENMRRNHAKNRLENK